MPKPHPGRRADRWLPGVKPEGWLACEGENRSLIREKESGKEGQIKKTLDLLVKPQDTEKNVKS
ncbi:hypothetical protein LEMLEM_LOCUS8758, partial [Lemmus lemmus]